MQCQRCILNWRKPIYLIFFWLFFFTLSFLSFHCINYFIHLDGHKVFIFLYSSLIFFWSCMMCHDILIYYFSVWVRKESHFNSSCHVMALCIIIFINMLHVLLLWTMYMQQNLPSLAVWFSEFSQSYLLQWMGQPLWHPHQQQNQDPDKSNRAIRRARIWKEDDSQNRIGKLWLEGMYLLKAFEAKQPKNSHIPPQ